MEIQQMKAQAKDDKTRKEVRVSGMVISMLILCFFLLYLLLPSLPVFGNLLLWYQGL